MHRARAGDGDALSILVKRYRPLAVSVAANFYLPGATRDDLHQEAMCGFLKAVRDFDGNGETPFRVFAKICMRRHVLTAIRHANRQKHQPINRFVSLDSCVLDGRGERTALSELLCPLESDAAHLALSFLYARKIGSLLDETLTRLERRFLGLYLEGMSYGEIASQTGSSWKRVDNTLTRARRKVRRSLATSEFFS